MLALLPPGMFGEQTYIPPGDEIQSKTGTKREPSTLGLNLKAGTPKIGKVRTCLPCTAVTHERQAHTYTHAHTRTRRNTRAHTHKEVTDRAIRQKV